MLLAVAGSLGQFAPSIRSRAIDHYAKAARATPGADPAEYRDRADRQARETLDFVPRYLTLAGAKGLALAGLLGMIRRGRVGPDLGRAALLGLTMIDLFGFGFGLNPSIDRADDRPMTSLLAALDREVGDSGRIIGLGAELPPNVLMRYGLRDARNYDSVELQRNLDWLKPLYDPTVEEQTSRREITWARILGARDRLRGACVRAVVGPTPPPAGFERSEKIGDVWVAWLAADPMIQVDGLGSIASCSNEPGLLRAIVDSPAGTTLIFRETSDPGWRAKVDGRPVPIDDPEGAFLSLRVPPGPHQVMLYYDPIEERIGVLASLNALVVALFALTGFGPFRFTRRAFHRLGRTQALGLESDS